MAAFEQIEAPVISNRDDFDARSGNRIERLIFNNRLLICIISLLLTMFFGYEASKLEINASFEKMLPQSQEFIRNYLANKESLRAQGNAIQIDVQNVGGDIYDPAYLKVLQEINDATFLMPGVDRAFMKSIWTPSVRWTEVTEGGFRGGPVMPTDYDGSDSKIALLKDNIARAGIVGSIVSNNQRSSLIIVPLLDIDPNTGKALDYKQLSHQLESIVRAKESDSIKVHIVGFGKLVGDLIDGLEQVITYFGIAALLAGIAIYIYTRCIRSTVLVLICSIAAAAWQLGIVRLLGLSVDPYSILVPFLVFAIGVSHGAQKMNGIMQDIGRGTHKYVAARYTFRRLFMAGLTALLADAVGFAVLMVIDIPVIQDIAMAASIGVAVLVFTNLVLLPVLLSYCGVSQNAAKRTLHGETKSANFVFDFLDRFTERRVATGTVVIAAVLGLGAYFVSLDLKIGDLEPGAPELRAESRYNRDVAYIGENYGLSSDQFVVIVKTPPQGVAGYQALIEQDRLAMKLRELPFVQTVLSAAGYLRFATAGGNENSPKWLSINRDPSVNANAMATIYGDHNEVINGDWSVGTITAYLSDHKAETLAQTVKVAKEFADAHSTNDYQFLLAAGSAGIQAATNITVERSSRTMLYLVYGAVSILCLIAFRSWRATVVAIVPLALTSILCEALMVFLGIGVKTATLPVIALGVGIGVDYALYLLSTQLAQQRAGVPLKEAYRIAVAFTGKVVVLVGITLAVGVITWAWSPIKFQADMGILLAFMFLWNMIGALIGIPALSYFLLRDVKAVGSQDATVSPSESVTDNLARVA
ncbi:efflux RND transporter permease subunit [Noviherbaspirillum sedimenti]|uniref:RND family transporter n=1 Tax=Noviherbaspirillum sedimenti TaxID=2320865 RepID=A0A3A3G3H7_9BURK|nr:MMPL family transporter [Noviherbaspirillum sedimenti]RJG01369.1 RND family transporter [Noviherbaspirillum sedimenti]